MHWSQMDTRCCPFTKCQLSQLVLKKGNGIGTSLPLLQFPFFLISTVWLKLPNLGFSTFLDADLKDNGYH